jgi:opacity protein-like surface antigen
MTNKTTTICCAVALLATTAATPALSQAKNFAGPSIAIGVGYNSTNYNNTLTTDAETDNIKTGNKNFNSLIDLSYGFEISPNFLISLGATYDLNESKNDILSADDGAGTNAQISAKLKNHYSIYAQPTYALNNNTAVFVKAGYHYAKSEIKLTANEFDGEATVTDSLSYSKNLNAWSYGVGAKTFLTNNAFLQFEGSLTKYDSQNKTFSGNVADFTFNHKPEVLTALVSIGYKF